MVYELKPAGHNKGTSVVHFMDERPFAGGIDRDRIGAMGLSLGGLTTTLVAFHPTLGDPRIRAAVSIAGPSAMAFSAPRIVGTT